MHSRFCKKGRSLALRAANNLPGGHGFVVHSPMGHMLIGHETARGYTLFYETKKVRQIWESSTFVACVVPDELILVSISPAVTAGVSRVQ